MNTQNTLISIGSYRGVVSAAFDSVELREQLQQINQRLRTDQPLKLSHGPDYVVKMQILTSRGPVDAAVKIFKRQGLFKDWHDYKNKSKAERSYKAAQYLQTHDIGTPEPIAWLELWQGKRLHESYYLCVYTPAICFRDALSAIYYQQRDNAPLMDLLMVVAPAVRAMHDAGFMHGDMGNQNILLPKIHDESWGKPQFIDLNRSRYSTQPLTEKQRAFDLSRIALPGAYLKIFKFIYSGHQDIPADLDEHEQVFRRRFERHTRTRKFRHPLRYLKRLRANTQAGVPPTYPAGNNIWLWDEKSAQPMTILDRREKHHYRQLRYALSVAWHSLCALPGIFVRYRRLLKSSYQTPVSLRDRIGVALHPHPDYIEQEVHLLNELGNPAVFVRFYHHETQVEWDIAIGLVKRLVQRSTPVMVALIQDRRAILQPDSWQAFLYYVVEKIANDVDHIEVTHALNRVKWGIWSAQEYSQLMQPAFALQALYPEIKLTGPACIDFEYHPAIAALKSLKGNQTLSALSHLLYVDRRGAPENNQGIFSLLEKCALLKALAQGSEHCADKVIISEVNWPVKYSGIWSPIGCPYEAPQWRREQPGETDDDYANYMLRYLVISLCSGHIEQVFWWRLSAHGYGLVDDRDNFRVRPAFTALAFFLKTLGNAEFIRKWDTPDDVFIFEFRVDSQTIWMVWAMQDSTYQPKIDYSRALDREGHALTQVKLCGSPYYLFS